LKQRIKSENIFVKEKSDFALLGRSLTSRPMAEAGLARARVVSLPPARARPRVAS
jgi:hypothetical protein